MLQAWPNEVAGPIALDITGVLTATRGDVLTFGVLFALYFASSGVESLRIGLNRAYGAAERRSWWLLRLESIALRGGRGGGDLGVLFPGRAGAVHLGKAGAATFPPWRRSAVSSPSRVTPLPCSSW